MDCPDHLLMEWLGPRVAEIPTQSNQRSDEIWDWESKEGQQAKWDRAMSSEGFK